MSGSWQEWLPRLAEFHAEVLKLSSGGGGAYLAKLHNSIRYGLTADLSLLDVSPSDAVTRPALTISLDPPSELIEFEDEPSDEQEVGTERIDPQTEIELPQGDGDDQQEQEEGEEESDDPDARALASRRAGAAAAARRIFLKQHGDPHNRETIIGFPLVAGRVGRQLVSGPLFYWSVEIELDAITNRLTLSRKSASPALNGVLLSKFTEEAAELDVLREQLIPIVQAEEFDLGSVETALRQIKNIFRPLQALRILEDGELGHAALGATLEAARGLSSKDPAIASPVPTLINAARSFAFILGDLEKIPDLGEGAGGSVVPDFVGDLPEDVEHEEPRGLPYFDTAEGGSPLWFPEESNEAQRRVGRKARRVRTLAVQGPPGTGKSQTIANVVCDLVTEGKTVLVTSHTRKALEVLSNKLPRIKHLAVSVLSSDRESLAKLKSELEGVQEAGDVDLDELTHKVERAEQALGDLDSELRHLDRRFTELRERESSEFSSHARYADVRELDRIHPVDRPDYNDADRISKALLEWSGILEELLPAVEQFRSFFRPSGEDETRAAELRRFETLAALLDLHRGLADALPRSSLSFVQNCVDAGVTGPETEAELRRWSTWLLETGRDVESELKRIRPLSNGQTAMDSVRRSLQELGELNLLVESWTALRGFFSETPLSGEELSGPLGASGREEAHAAASALRSASASFFGWVLSPTARRARKSLAEAGFIIGARKEAESWLGRIEAILEWRRARSDCRELAETYDSLFPPGLTRPIETEASTRGLERHAADRLRVLNLLREVEASPLAASSDGPIAEFGRELLDQLGTAPASELSGQAVAADRRLRELRGLEELLPGLQLAEDWWPHRDDLVAAIREREPNRIGNARLDHLKAFVEHYRAFQRMVDLETSELADVARTLAEVEAELRHEGAIPSWIDRANTALDAHRLSSLLRQSLSANPDDLGEISDALGKGLTRRRRLIEQIIDRRRGLSVRRAVRSAHTNNALLNMRKLLGRKRMSASFLTLRDRIEYRELLKVFPCWICSIDDVARLFPLVSGLFDYIIVDEASQCPQTALLPLAYRARRAIVVGDRKQLQPSSSRFLLQKAVDVLSDRTSINKHPVAEVFDGRESLLAVAERYRQESDFLDEHFRCDPEIIRWSNDKFYDNRLRILTHRRDRVFRPVLEIRELKDADEDTDEKVNRREAEAIVGELKRLIESGEVDRMKIGVISPFRPQADLIDGMIQREFAGRPELRNGMGLLASTADGFQGDERDIILYSFRYGPSSHAGSVRAIEREEERLNVAFTRAKRKVVCFTSHSLNRFPDGLIRSFLEHAKEVQDGPGPDGPGPDHFDSNFERSVCFALRDRGLSVRTQVPVGRYLVDLVAEDEEGRVLGIECDGEFKFNEFGELRPQDYQRQDLIERAGWVLHRISGRSYLLNPEREIDRVLAVLETLPTAQDREIATGPRVTITREPAATPGTQAESESERGAEHPGVEGSAGEEPVSTEEEALETEADGILAEFGATRADQVVGLKRLWRWLILEQRLEGSAIDALGDIETKLESGVSLGEPELEYLEELLYSAYGKGYDPDLVDDLPSEKQLDVTQLRFKKQLSLDEVQASVGGPESPPWDPTRLSPVEGAMLEYLWDSRPEGRTKYQIASALRREGFPRGLGSPKAVNQLLYGSLEKFVEKRGDRPPRWFSVAAGDDRDAGDG